MTETLRSVHIHVDDASQGVAISEDLVGIFFEDLSYAADGGLYAELIRNRAFEFSGLDQPGWGPLTGWEVRRTSEAFLAVSTDDPAFTASPTHIVVSAPAHHSLTLVNAGYDGISVRSGAEYRLSAHLRRLSGAGTVRAAVVDSGGAELASGMLGPLTDEWSPHSLQLRVDADATDAVLELTVTGPGDVAIDHVSLFPLDTFMGQQNGLRRDMVEALVDLKPRFVRFPGGCISHGLGLANMYRWKDTLGPVEERRQNFNLWGYHQSMGLGYLEYFLLCEQLGAKPLPVVAAGVCCQNLPEGPLPIPDDEMDAYIQEVLDLVEWANGPTTSVWGARRAAAGHPEPFGLEYLAVGNEDKQNDVFRDRFRRIHDAIEAAYPDIVVIGTVGPNPFGRDYDEGWAFARERNVPIVDEHSYKSPRWFFENLDRFDAYDRGGPAVYLGEWGSKGNRMLNALAEAAYLGALERNGDLVRLSSWAPLFAKLGHVHWTPDLIYFDNERVLPSLNYFVQRMHSTATGDTAIPVRVDGAPEFHRSVPIVSGVSIRSSGGTVDVTDVRFNDGPGVDAHYADSSADPAEPDEVIIPVTTTEADYRLRLTATVTHGDDGFIVGFGAVGTSEHFLWNFGLWRNRHAVLGRRTDGYFDELVDPVPFHVENGRAHQVEIRVTGRGRRIVCLLDGEIVSEWEDNGAAEQRFSATAVRNSVTGEIVIKVVNATDAAIAGRIVLADGPLKGPVDREMLAGDPDAGAPGEPAPFRPEACTVVVVDGQVDVPAWSFTTLRRRSNGRTQ